MGGGTGTGAIVALSEELRKRFADSPVPRLVIGVVTLPFEVETARMEIAKKGLDNLKKSCDTVVVIDNDRLVKIAGNLPFREALGVANTTIGKFIKGITESITTASLINLDYADLRAIMQGAGLASIGVGEGTGEGRVEQAVERAINGRLLDIEDVTKAWGLLIYNRDLNACINIAHALKRGMGWGRCEPPEPADEEIGAKPTLNAGSSRL